MNVQPPKQTTVILMLCVPTWMVLIFVVVLVNIRVTEKTAQVNIS